MTTYTIKPGQWNFRPLEPIRPRFVTKGFFGWAVFDESAWFDWGDDRDILDWNKLKGLTSYFSPNNRHSAMIAWRPSPEMNLFEITGYTNYPGKKAQHSGLKSLKAFAGEEIFFTCTINAFSVYYRIECGERQVEIEHKFWKRWIYREVGTSIGGANNSPGPYGGKATQNMKIDIDFNLK